MALLRPLALLALAAASPLPGIGDSDSRHLVDARAAPWTALARLQVPGVDRCTAVAVAPGLVLTAAHCLWNRLVNRFVPPDTVHVLAGYDAGRFVSHVIATGYRVAPGYDPLRPDATRGADVALVWLALPLTGTTPLNLAATPAPGTAAMLGGYNQDRNEVIEADTNCHVTASGIGILTHDCAATHGTSGAPLLVRGFDGAWRIAGIQTGAFVDRIGGVAVAAATLQALLGDSEDRK